MKYFRALSLALMTVATGFTACAPEDRTGDNQPGIVYTGDHLRHVLFPIGGIGTGNILLGGRGEIHELEIFNQAHRDELRPDMTFFSLWVREEGKEPVKRILEREHLNDFPNGFGVPRQQLAGLPRFKEVIFRGQYPIAQLEFQDEAVPLKVQLEAYNPFIPLDVENSSLPVAIMKWKFTNTGKQKVDFSISMNIANPMKNLNHRSGIPPAHSTTNEFFQSDNMQGIFMANLIDQEHHEYGNLAMFTTEKEADIQTRWYRGGWWDNSHIFWNDFSDDGRLEDIRDSEVNLSQTTDVASILIHKSLKPGESVEIPFYLSWFIPNRMIESSAAFGNPEVENAIVQNHYTLGFEDSKDIASYLLKNIESLESNTRRFHDRLMQSTLPLPVTDAASANLAIMKTNVFMRTGDGHYHGFEGIGLDFGCCPGNCTHVFNYAQTIASLFPSIERDMRETAFLYETYENGYQSFRTVFPVCDCAAFKNVAADGQMGNIMRVYREWKYSGDTEWLRALWPKVKLALEFAWKGSGDLVKQYPWMSNAIVPWDPDKEGVMRGEQHNTYDINFFGPNMMTGSLYLGALKACSEMANAMNEPQKAKEYLAVYESGLRKYNELLWNGDYFVQKVEVMEGLSVPSRLRSPDSNLPKYQYGDGCLADQLLGQYLAYVSGMGYILEEDKVHKTLSSIFKNNFIESFSDFENVQRVYALNKESGLVICTWPNGNREAIPFPYADEAWTGVEYQVAASLIYAGLVDEGLKVVEAVRGRYNGLNRNPYAEIESGFYYVRAMSSWAVLMALSGFSWDGVEQSIAFNPAIHTESFMSFWATGSAWGNYSQGPNAASLEIDFGQMALKQIKLPLDNVKKVRLNGTEISFQWKEGKILLEEMQILKQGDVLEVQGN